MLHEYALDPAALSTWESLRYLVEKFGVEHGRLISEYPSDWKMSVYKKCARFSTMRLKAVEVMLRGIDSKLLPTRRAYDDNHSWLPNAETQHRIEPFRAIIAASNPNGGDCVLISDDLNESIARWKVDRELPVERQAVRLAQVLKPLFSMSREILFIDPHFNPEESRFREPLILCLETAHRGGRVFRRIEYHLRADLTGTKEHFERVCKQWIARRLPPSASIKFIRWKQWPGGEKLHPRYVLTEFGGLRFEVGLDSGYPGETTDVSLLDRTLYQKRWEDYQFRPDAAEPSSFELVDSVVICGQAAPRGTKK